MAACRSLARTAGAATLASPSTGYTKHRSVLRAGKPPAKSVSFWSQNAREWAGQTNHSGAGEDVPAETHAIALFDVAPLLLERLIVHGGHDDLASMAPRLAGWYPSTGCKIVECETCCRLLGKMLRVPPFQWAAAAGDGAEGEWLSSGIGSTDVARNLGTRLALTNSCPSKLRTSSLSDELLAPQWPEAPACQPARTWPARNQPLILYTAFQHGPTTTTIAVRCICFRRPDCSKLSLLV